LHDALSLRVAGCRVTAEFVTPCLFFAKGGQEERKREEREDEKNEKREKRRRKNA